MYLNLWDGLKADDGVEGDHVDVVQLRHDVLDGLVLEDEGARYDVDLVLLQVGVGVSHLDSKGILRTGVRKITQLNWQRRRFESWLAV